MIHSYDVGSLPLRRGSDTIWSGARASGTLLPLLMAESDNYKAFEEEVVRSFTDKLKAGIKTPNYPQFRDMNQMFFDLLRGIEKTDSGYQSLGGVTARPGASIPEMDIIRRNASRIADMAGVDEIRVKMCVTGPYTMASFFRIRDAKLFQDLGHALAEIASRSLFDTRKAKVTLLFVDEPVLGFVNDPLLDYGSAGRDSLRGAWEEICESASGRGVETGMHLHDTSDNLFWEVDHLKIVESHVDDPIYTSESTRERLEQTDKLLKASISVTIFDNLIASKIGKASEADVQQIVGEKWSEIRRGFIDPLTFLEDSKLMLRRLEHTIEHFGPERVRYAGPECGLSSFPTYECAMECLRRVSEVVKAFNSEA